MTANNKELSFCPFQQPLIMTFKVHGTLFIMFISSNTYLIGLSRHVTSCQELIIIGILTAPGTPLPSLHESG
jgi:hypothetical protein